MPIENAIALSHLEGVYPLLDLLQVGFLVIDPGGELRHTSFLGARLLGRRLTADRLRQLLADAWDPLCAEVLAGRSAGERWRELVVPRPGGGLLHLSVRSVAIAFAPDHHGVLLAISDVSDVVEIHGRYNALMVEMQASNQALHRQIAAVLREHEDDLAQFNEIERVAPAIFASFAVEASDAVAEVRTLLARPRLDSDHVDAGLRATHTLKGNARGLGFNFIAGRAHAVEDMLRAARIAGRFAHGDEAAVLIDDLDRAIARAVALRSRLGANANEPGVARAAGVAATAALDTLAAARELLAADHPARTLIEQAAATLRPLGQVQLAQLFEYLRSTAVAVAGERGLDAPEVVIDGGAVEVSIAVHRALQQALPHLVRNAVWHGLEPAAERRGRGKATAGRVAVAARSDGGELLIEVGDDGRGLDRNRLRDQAAALGVAIREAAALDELVFHPGLSTAGAVGMDAGRGYGAAAARAAVEQVGGKIRVRSVEGQGVTFTITVPIATR
jgi:chemotaxis protein histidine kinase CheA